MIVILMKTKENWHVQDTEIIITPLAITFCLISYPFFIGNLEIQLSKSINYLSHLTHVDKVTLIVTSRQDFFYILSSIDFIDLLYLAIPS